ncbi:histidine kinase [Myxococcus sp. CA051A]|uniref:sensor histidine kinase n=1 Tax=unclassified Myxococcus TaxID=2648731 RepID=UPI00157B1DC5|nr:MULTISPECIES: histidine kinase [unclassified Myxococcus]NTX33193.1 histidine kinase [Myxococcus sp. CA033]NTX54402.1 histidine kinase [Myxococcus sp. CA039A]NTX59741.1 histidine kinase [Myxococcus sp. CA051A]
MRLGARFWKVQLWGWGAYALAGYVLSIPNLEHGGTKEHLFVIGLKLVRSLLGLGISLTMARVLSRLWARRAPAWVLGTVGLTLSSLLAVVWLGLLRWSFGLVPVFHPAFTHDALNCTIVLLAWSALFLGNAYRLDLEAERERALRALSLATEARWQMLRYQVNPHFLFNALNSIRALVDEEPGRARQMITELADFFRYSLLETREREVPLGEELRAIRSYLEIQRIRFEERLRVTFDVGPGAEEARLPGFLIHPLVENAVKHGLDSQKGPLELRIRASRQGDTLEVEVANTGSWREPTSRPESTGTGLANVRERLEHAYPGRHRFTVGADGGWVKASLHVELARREAA